MVEGLMGDLQALMGVPQTFAGDVIMWMMQMEKIQR